MFARRVLGVVSLIFSTFSCGDNIVPLVPGDANGCLIDSTVVDVAIYDTTPVDCEIDAAFDAAFDVAFDSMPDGMPDSTIDSMIDASPACPPSAPVDLNTAGDFAILAKSAVSTVPISAVTGDVGVSPAAETFITGFSLIDDSSTTFATSTQVTGRVYAADMTPPTPAKMTAAISDMELAFTATAARAPDVIELGAGNIGGMNLKPCVYKWGTGLLIPTSITLTGTASDVWIFQVAQTLLVADGAQVVLAGGARAQNVFWQVGEGVTIGTTAHFEGVVLGATAIALNTGASINGRLLAQTAVTLDMNVVVQP